MRRRIVKSCFFLAAILLWGIFGTFASVHSAAAQSASAWPLVNCATNTPCANNAPVNTHTGDTLPVSMSKLNAAIKQLATMFGSSSNLALNGKTTASDLIGLWTGCSSGFPALGYQGACIAVGGGTPGGTSGQIQYNNAGALGGVSNFTYSSSGNLTIGAPSSGVALTITGNGGNAGLVVNNGTTTGDNVDYYSLTGGQSSVLMEGDNSSSYQVRYGVASGSNSIFAGTSVGDFVLDNLSSTGAIRFGTNGLDRADIFSDGGVTVGSPTGGNQGAGTLNATGLYVNGAAALYSGGALGTPSSGVGTNITGVNAASVGGFTLPCTVPTLVSGDYLTNNGTTCSWAAGSGSGVTLQTGGTNNASQTTLNLVGMGNISVTNPSGGTVNIGPITEPLGNGGLPITSLPYTLPSTESGYQEVVNSSAAGAINVPPASGAFAKAQFDISNYGAGTVTLTPLAIATPGTPTLSQAGATSTIPAGTYNVAVSALDAAGQTLVSTSASITISTSNADTITVTDPGVSYATSYNIWISTGAIGNGTTGVAYENVSALGSGVTLTAIPATTATTPTTNTTASTINNATSITMAQNTQCGLNSDNTNWQVIGCTALSAAVQPESLGFALPSVPQNTTDYGMTGVINITQATSAIATFSGTLKNLYVYTANAPASGQTFTFTIYVGTPGSMTATGITCQITSAATNPCSDLTHSASITAGQSWSLQIVTSATSGATGQVAVGLELN